MFGRNEVAKPMHAYPGGTLLVREVFFTLQGEGPDAGCPAVFVRLAKCNLRCFFCDTDFDQGDRVEIETLLRQVLDINNGCKLVVLTGGEPFLQNIAPFVRRLNENGIRVSVETAGTVMPPDISPLFWRYNTAHNKIVCSPKTPKVHSELVPLIHSWKYVVREGDTDQEDGLPIKSTQDQARWAKLFRRPDYHDGEIFVSPMDEYDPVRNELNVRHATSMALKHGYRLSIQVHKLPGVQLP